MKINKISIHNFYSIRDMDITFDNYSGINLINGKNLDEGGSVGTGKSAILEAITWGLFGKTIRKSTEESIVNNVAKKDCYVMVQVNETCFIHRSRRATKLEFYIDGVNETLDNSASTQALIEKHLEINYKLFLASTVFGQHNLVEFLGTTTEDKRTIIRNFLNLDDVFDKREKIKGIKSNLNNKIKENNVLIKQYDKFASKLTTKLESIREAKEQGLAVLGVTEELLSKYSYNDLIKIEAEIENNRNTLKEDKKLLQGLIEQKDNLNAKIEKGVYFSKTLCTACNDGNFVEKVTEQEVSEYTDSLEKVLDDIFFTELLINNRTVLIKQLTPEISSDIVARANKIFTLISEQATADSDLEKFKKDTNLLVEANKKYNKELEVMKFWEVAFSEKGLIRYIIRNILDYFNTSCNYYLNFLSTGKLEIVFNEKLEEQIFNSGRKVHFASLSGGERKKLNLAVALSLQKLLCFSEETSTNLLFLDEITDSLDESSIEGLYILLQDLSKTKILFIITHSKHLKMLLKNEKGINLLKRDGQTKLINK